MSKFGDIFQARPTAAVDEEKASALQPDADTRAGEPEAVEKRRRRAPRAMPPAAPSRVHGKSSSTEYRQITAYLRRDTHDAARRLLVGADEDLSDVLETLLATWVAKREGQ